MSKSLKNFIPIREALQGHSADTIRMLFLLRQYDQPLDWPRALPQVPGRTGDPLPPGSGSGLMVPSQTYFTRSNLKTIPSSPAKSHRIFRRSEKAPGPDNCCSRPRSFSMFCSGAVFPEF